MRLAGIITFGNLRECLNMTSYDLIFDGAKNSEMQYVIVNDAKIMLYYKSTLICQCAEYFYAFFYIQY